MADAWEGAGAVCQVVGTVGAVGVVKLVERCARWLCVRTQRCSCSRHKVWSWHCMRGCGKGSE